MRPRLFPTVGHSPKATGTRWCSIALLTIGQGDAQANDRGASAPAVKVNRTVPLVEPPKTTLEFSAKPTTQEISRARVFEIQNAVPIVANNGLCRIDNAGTFRKTVNP